LDRVDQDRLVERFEQVVCGAETADTLGIAGLVVAGDNNDRHWVVHGRYRRKHIKPRYSGHVKVQQHAVWTIRAGGFQKVIAGLKRLDIITMSFEQTPQREAHLRLIIQNSDDCLAACHSAVIIAGRATYRQLYLG
jgi:hypothetical protein